MDAPHRKQAVVIAVQDREFGDGTVLARRLILRPYGRPEGAVRVSVSPGRGPMNFTKDLEERIRNA